VSVQEAPPRPAPAGAPSTVRMLLQHDPVAPNPPFLDNVQLQYVSCGRLMTYDGRTAELVPQLAAALPSVSADERVYTFRIKPGYRFSPPSGQPVTAAAFERMIERNLPIANVVGAAAYQAGRAGRIAGVTARGDRLTIRLTRPTPTLPASLASFGSCAVPPDTPARPRGLESIATAGRGANGALCRWGYRHIWTGLYVERDAGRSSDPGRQTVCERDRDRNGGQGQEGAAGNCHSDSGRRHTVPGFRQSVHRQPAGQWAWAWPPRQGVG